jgi:uncharacterized membrane protein
LALSLALNLAILGMVGGAMVRGGMAGHTAMVRDLGFGPFSEALRPEDRKALRQAFFERVPDFRQTRRQMRADTAALLEALRAEPFDAGAVSTALQNHQDHLSGQLNLGQELLADHLLSLTTPERLAFADRLQKVLQRRPARASD